MTQPAKFTSTSPKFGKWIHADTDNGAHAPKLVQKLVRDVATRGSRVEWSPYQRLAKAILLQAAKEAVKGDQDAIDFLTTPNEDLEFWRALADF